MHPLHRPRSGGACRFVPPLLPALASAALALGLGLSLAACGDDVRRVEMPDAGPQGDTEPPTLTSTDPLAGERGVSPDTAFLFQFDEAMDTSQGSVRLQPGDQTFTVADGNWFAEDTRFSVRPPENLDQGTVYTLSLVGFTDLAGNPAAGDLELEFETLDEEAPTVIAASPDQDADGVSPGLDEIRLTFSEPMDTDSGEVDLQGGPRSLGEPVWEDEDTVFVVPVSGLDALRDYELFAFGFQDRFGNLYDDTVLVDEGVLRFATGPDVEAPRVRASVPMEGQSGVNPARSTASLTFSEPMDTSVRGARFFRGVDDAEGVELVGRWSSDATRITFDALELSEQLDYRLVLAGFGYADEVGNALDESTFLGDGALDFSTGEDDFPPVVLAASPSDGSDGVLADALDAVSLTFNEPMDTSVTTAPFTETRGTADPTEGTLTGTWDDAAREFTFDPGQLRQSGSTYAIDVTGFVDLAGNAVAEDALDDGRLDLIAAGGSGESCRSPLTIDQATVSDGVFTFDLPDDFVSEGQGGGETCDSTGSTGDDVVIEYQKTTADLAGGGTLLRIRTDSDPDDHNVEVSTTCDPGDETFAPLTCITDREQNELFLDVGPGTYFIFVADELGGSSFDATLITIEELDAFPEGEACEAPFTTASSIYTPPATADDPHTWVIPEDSIFGYDRGPRSGEGLISCDSDGEQGHDAVVEFQKTSATSILEITLTSLDTFNDFSAEVTTTCDPLAPDALSLICGNDADDFEFAVGGPAGPVYLWVAAEDGFNEFPGVRVEIREVEVSEGEACSTARRLDGDPGTPQALTLDSGERFNAGSCFTGTGPVTWYRYTPSATADYVAFQPNGTGGLVLRNTVGFAQLRCTSADLPFVPATFTEGEDLCIGVESGGSISELTVLEGGYDGVTGTVTDPGYRRALDEDGDEESWTSDQWMAVTPTTLYLAETGDVYGLPKDGGERAVLYETPDGVTTSTVGDAGWALGERLYSLDDTTSSSSNRLYELWDGRSAPWDPLEWDVSISGVYPSDDMTGLGYDGARFFYVSNDFSEAAFFSIDASSPSTPVEEGILDTFHDALGLAVDDTFVYVIGELEAGDVEDEEGVYRIRRSDLGTADTVPETIVSESTLPGIIDFSSRAAIFVDDPVDPEYLYFRTVDGSVPNAVHVVKDPDGTPLYLGTIAALGDSGDYGMVYDPDLDAIFLFETATDAIGRIVRLD